jgi:hypothetical protein
MHFMNPVPVMLLVEIIPGIQTSQTTLDTTLQTAKAMGKITTTSRVRNTNEAKHKETKHEIKQAKIKKKQNKQNKQNENKLTSNKTNMVGFSLFIANRLRMP